MLVSLVKKILADLFEVLGDLLSEVKLFRIDCLIPLILLWIGLAKAGIVHIVLLNVLQHHLPQHCEEPREIDVEHGDLIDFLNVAIEKEAQVTLFQQEWYSCREKRIEKHI